MLADNPQMKSDQNQRVKGEKITCRARWLKNRKQSAHIKAKKKKKKRKGIESKENQRGGLNQMMSMKISMMKKSKMQWRLRVRERKREGSESCVRGLQRGNCKVRGQRASEDRQVQVELVAKRVEEGRGSETVRGYTWEETTSV